MRPSGPQARGRQHEWAPQPHGRRLLTGLSVSNPNAPPKQPQRPPKKVGLRNIFYPYLIWAFFKEWRHETALCGSPWNPILLTPVFQAFLSGEWVTTGIIQRAGGV